MGKIGYEYRYRNIRINLAEKCEDDYLQGPKLEIYIRLQRFYTNQTRMGWSPTSLKNFKRYRRRRKKFFSAVGDGVKL